MGLAARPALATPLVSLELDRRREVAILENGEVGALLMFAVLNAEGRLSVQTVWARTADRRYGPRLTRFDNVAGAAGLLCRLGELAPQIAWQPGDLSAPPLIP